METEVSESGWRVGFGGAIGGWHEWVVGFLGEMKDWPMRRARTITSADRCWALFKFKRWCYTCQNKNNRPLIPLSHFKNQKECFSSPPVWGICSVLNPNVINSDFLSRTSVISIRNICNTVISIHKSKKEKKAFPVEEHEHSSAGASVQFSNTELHRAFAFRASQIRGFACGKSVRGGISVTVMVIHARSLRRLCREGMRIWFSVKVPFKLYWRTPPWSQKKGKTVGRFQAIYHTMFNYVYHVVLLSFGGLFLKNWILG